MNCQNSILYNYNYVRQSIFGTYLVCDDGEKKLLEPTWIVEGNNFRPPGINWRIALKTIGLLPRQNELTSYTCVTKFLENLQKKLFEEPRIEIWALLGNFCTKFIFVKITCFFRREKLLPRFKEQHVR